MGNAPSIAELPPEWEDILPNITHEDIVRSSCTKCRREEDRVYLDDDIFDLDAHVPLALAVLSAHPPLKDVRFKLVPGKLNEDMFWAAVFGILNDGGINVEDLVGAIEDDYIEGDEKFLAGEEVDGSSEAGDGEILRSSVAQYPQDRQSAERETRTSPRSSVSHVEQVYCDSDDALEATADALLEEIEAQQAHIARLQKSLREANHKTRKLALELHKERKKNAEVNVGKGGELSLPPKCPHKGSWEMHPDCADFMELDDQLKENLRQEKRKRLNEVKSQMKFILDSDDIRNSYGKWSCCGKDTYDAEGCA